jgi:acetyltransferase-like isoleucine patch superfamily enzyme
MIYQCIKTKLKIKNVYLRSFQKVCQAGMPFTTNLLIDVKNATIQKGNNTRINGAYIHAQRSICTGENCIIASGVNIIDSNGHNLYSTNRTIGRDTPKDIKIGNNVWIGLNAVILKNTNIGNNSVISAGSVVKSNFPLNSLIVGNPDKIVKKIQKNENRYSQ